MDLGYVAVPVSHPINNVRKFPRVSMAGDRWELKPAVRLWHLAAGWASPGGYTALPSPPSWPTGQLPGYCATCSLNVLHTSCGSGISHEALPFL